MKNINIQLPELMESIFSSDRADFIAPYEAMSLEANEGQVSRGRESDGYVINLANEERFTVSPYCQGVIASRLAPGFRRFSQELEAKEMKDLVIENTNRLFKKTEGKGMLRVLSNGNDFARTLVSDRYLAVDDDLVFGKVIPEIQASGKFKSIGGNRTDTNTYIKMVSRDPSFAMDISGRHREFSIGFIASNSEVGCGQAKFEAFFTDSYCDNGCIFSKHILAGLNITHVGEQIKTDFGRILGGSVNRAKMASINDLIIEATRKALDTSPESIEMIKAEIEAAAQAKIKGDEIESIKNVVERVKVPKNLHDRVIMEMDPADNTRFGVQAAVTQLAQKVGSYDQRIQLEQAGGEILRMPAKVWEACQEL